MKTMDSVSGQDANRFIAVAMAKMSQANLARMRRFHIPAFTK